MNIKYDGVVELKQILNIMISLGYEIHGDPDREINTFVGAYGTSYSTVATYFRGDYRNITLGNDTPDYVWSKDMSVILSLLNNYKKEPNKIVIREVGEYYATVKKDSVTIYDINVSSEEIEKIYEIIESGKFPKPFVEMHITTKNDQEHKSLMALLASFGFKSSCMKDIKSLHAHFKDCPSTVVCENFEIGGNYKYYGDGEKEYFFVGDFFKIYTILSDLVATPKPMKLGGYDVIIQKDVVKVGCQDISHEKVREIRNALKSLQD